MRRGTGELFFFFLFLGMHELVIFFTFVFPLLHFAKRFDMAVWAQRFEHDSTFSPGAGIVIAFMFLGLALGLLSDYLRLQRHE